MIYFLVIVLVGLMGMVVFSLFRGLDAFRQGIGAEPGSDEEAAVTELQLRQNRMMWARIKYQALAVVVIAVLLMMSR